MAVSTRPRVLSMLSAASLVAFLLASTVDASAPHEFRALRSLSPAASAPGPLALDRVTVGQTGDDLYLGVRTSGRWSSAELARDPRRRICLLIGTSSATATPTRRVCVTALGRRGALRVGALTLGAAGRAGHARAIEASLSRPDSRSLEMRFALAAIGLARGRYSWSVQSSWTGPRCATTPSPCIDSVPARGAVGAAIATVHPVGCTRGRARFATSGPSGRRAVALTFDDGPSAYTASILSTLERNHVNATFFTIGDQVAARAPLLLRELRDGDVVGNHTWNHPNVAGGGSLAATQMSETSRAIERATRFSPCLFRAPYGATSGALFSVAERLGLTTVGWNVDPRDWALPGTGAIVSGVVGAVKPGSIVIMHDGGGPRGETVAALPAVISALRRKGYSLDTVPALLGTRVIYGR